MIFQREKIENGNNLNKPNGVSHLHLRALLFLIIFFALLTTTTQAKPFAEQAKRFEDGVAWTKNINVTKKAINVEDYCADNDVSCKTKVHNPDQSGMNSAQVNSKKTSAYFNNKQATAVQDNFDKGRPTINPNDEIYRMALIGQDNAYEISHGISTAYADCESGMSCTIDNYLQHCSIPTNNPVKCEKTASIVTGNWSYKSKTVTPHILTFLGNIKVSGIPSNASNTTITLTNTYGWRGNRFTRTAVYANRIIIGYVHNKGTYTFPLSKEITKTGTVQLGIYTAESTAIMFKGSYTVKWGIGNPTITWADNCSVLLPSCTLVSDSCIEGAGTRTVGGQSVYLSCWKYQKTYNCKTNDTCVPNVPIISQTCKSKLMGVCIEYDAVQELEKRTCKENALICGETSFCLEGDCYEPTPTQSQDFSKAASMLAAVSKAAEDITDPPLIFTGKNQRCTIKIAGIANCCKDGGWGTDINITSCSSEEKALGAAQEEQLTISLGSYCAKKVLGVCVRKKRSYCVFDSKLARIIQEQGRPQIGRGFGSAKNPDCSAITPEEMQQMDFSQIDFKDFYGDMQNNTNLPNMDEIKARIQSTYEK